MKHFVKSLLEKHAGTLGMAGSMMFGKIPWVQKYRQVASSPMFKAKKAIGKGLIGLGVASAPVGYALHQLHKQPLQKNVIPGIYPSQQ